MTPEQEKLVVRMVGQGKTIVQICNTLGLEWPEASKYLKANDKKSFLGAKKVITNRLIKLNKEQNQSNRNKFAAEADKWVDYLYYDMKRLCAQLDQAKRDLKKVSQVLEG